MKVLYDNGDVEVLRFENEHLEFVERGQKPTKVLIEHSFYINMSISFFFSIE